MLEARLAQGAVLKRLFEAAKELVNDANFDCNESGISLQAMDTSHVALVTILLKAEGFDPFRCDRNLALGVNLGSLNKLLKCSGNDDIITLKADDQADVLSLVFESPDQERISEYELKLMDIDSDHLGIPEQEFDAVVKMSSVEFQKICRDMHVLSETVVFDITKDGIKFSAEGELGNGSVTIKNGATIDKEADEQTTITLFDKVNVPFAMKFLTQFTKATSLSKTVVLSVCNQSPMLVEYKIGEVGHLRFYLAPKIEEEE